MSPPPPPYPSPAFWVPQDHGGHFSSCHVAGWLDAGGVTTLGVSDNRLGDSSTNVKLKRVVETGGSETESAQATPVAGV